MRLTIYVPDEMGKRVKNAYVRLGLNISSLFQDAFNEWDTKGRSSFVNSTKLDLAEKEIQELKTKLRQILSIAKVGGKSGKKETTKAENGRLLDSRVVQPNTSAIKKQKNSRTA